MMISKQFLLCGRSRFSVANSLIICPDYPLIDDVTNDLDGIIK
jgi:hypothetical protein